MRDRYASAAWSMDEARGTTTSPAAPFTHQPTQSHVMAHPYWHGYTKRRSLSHARLEWIHYCHVSESRDSWKRTFNNNGQFPPGLSDDWRGLLVPRELGSLCKSQYWFNLAFTSEAKQSDLILACSRSWWHKIVFYSSSVSASGWFMATEE